MSTATYPNTPLFSAQKTGRITLQQAGKAIHYQLSTVEAGTLHVPSGKLIACDPFVTLDKTDNPYVNIPAGSYPVVVTLADVSDALDGSHYREAYCSLIIRDGETVTRRFLSPSSEGDATDRKPVSLNQGFYGVPVDAGRSALPMSRPSPPICPRRIGTRRFLTMTKTTAGLP